MRELEIKLKPHGCALRAGAGNNNGRVTLFRPTQSIDLEIFPCVESCAYLAVMAESFFPENELFVVDHKKENPNERKARAQAWWKIEKLNLFSNRTYKLRVVGGGDGKNAIVGRLKVRLVFEDDRFIEAVSERCLFVGKNTCMRTSEVAQEVWETWDLGGEWGFDYYERGNIEDVDIFFNDDFWGNEDS